MSFRQSAQAAINQLETGLPRIAPYTGTLEALKWVALCLMTLDHVNNFLWNFEVPWMYAMGRLAMPIFAMTLAFNLARSPLPARTLRVAKRLVVYGVAASVPFIALGRTESGLPLNILFTLAAATAVIALWQLGRVKAALALFAVAGAVADFKWPGLALVLATHAYCARPSSGSLFGVLASLSFLGGLNGNHWAFAGAALFVAAGILPCQVNLARSPSVFYLYYPAHLVVLLALQELR